MLSVYPEPIKGLGDGQMLVSQILCREMFQQNSCWLGYAGAGEKRF
ncbi:uncharacterized protein METZ01_LOCUS401476, partial [marine metagenome]